MAVIQKLDQQKKKVKGNDMFLSKLQVVTQKVEIAAAVSGKNFSW